MATRGRPKGSMHRHSLSAKLAAMAVGETLVFPDQMCPGGRNTHMTSALTTYPRRIPALEGMKFTGQRATVVGVDMETMRAMIVTRTA